MSVTAIITHYWNSRTADLPKICKALSEGEEAPEKIIIWNNTANDLDSPDVDIINAGRNWGIAARYAAAFLAKTQLVLFQDNDLMVQPGTLRNMLNKFPGTRGVSLELQGRMIGRKDLPYSSSQYITNQDTTVDIGLSRLSLMLRQTAVDLAGVIPPDVMDDDLWTSKHCRIDIASRCCGEGWTNLAETEGMCHDLQVHMDRRDAEVKKLWNL